jgi:hypothetical protein
MYLISPSGEFLDFYTQLMTAPEIADKVAATIRTPGSTGAGGILSWLGFGKQ